MLSPLGNPTRDTNRRKSRWPSTTRTTSIVSAASPSVSGQIAYNTRYGRATIMRISGLMSGRRVPSYRKSTGRSIFLPIDHNSLIAARGLFGAMVSQISSGSDSAAGVMTTRVTQRRLCPFDRGPLQ